MLLGLESILCILRANMVEASLLVCIRDFAAVEVRLQRPRNRVRWFLIREENVHRG
jgi:hypothetical protein